MWLTKNFHLKEFFPSGFYKLHGESCIRYLDPKIPVIAQFIRDYFMKPVVINGSFGGQEYNYSGFRPPGCEIGAPMSQHRFGRAIDIKISRMESQEVQSTILEKWESHFSKCGITAIEQGTKGWTHLDCRWANHIDLSSSPIIIPFYSKKK